MSASPVAKRQARWGRRIGLSIFTLLLLLVGAHALWAWTALRSLTTELTRLRAGGEWTTLTDMVMPPVPDAENAALDFAAAEAAIPCTGQAFRAYMDAGDSPEEWPWTAPSRARVQGRLRDCKEALGLVASAAEKPRTNWGFDPTLAPFDALRQQQQQLSTSRQLAIEMRNAAREAHLSGDDAAVVARLIQLLRYAQVTDERPGGLVVHLVAVGMQAMVCEATAQLALDLNVGGVSASATRPAHPASREQLLKLLTALNDEAPQRAGMHRALAGERVMDVELAEAFLRGKPVGNLVGGFAPAGAPTSSATLAMKLYVLSPLLRDDTRLLVLGIEQTIAASTMPNLPAVKNRLGDPWATLVSGGSRHFWGKLLAVSTGKALETDFRQLTTRRMAAVSIALRLYAIDHGGKLPDELEALVPKYLPAIPNDPMAAGGKPLRYIPRSDDPIIYSVGNDGVDDGGSEQPTGRLAKYMKPGEKVYLWLAQDAVIHLKPQRATAVEPK